MPSISASPNGANVPRNRQFTIRPLFVGPPRLNPYKRLLSRFYEPLFLLRILGQTRGSHITDQSLDLGPEKKLQRKFLHNLSYVCDFEKGGKSCTAIGLEDSETCYKFWVASNKAINKTVDFLKNALNQLKNVASHSPRDLEASKKAFVEFCLTFATSRIKNEAQCLCKGIEEATKANKGLFLPH